MGDNIDRIDDIVESIAPVLGMDSIEGAAQPPEEDHPLVLEVNHVSGGYRTPGLLGKGKYNQVLYDVDFNIRHGEIMGLVGESGTGKSTLDPPYEAPADHLPGSLQFTESRVFRGVDTGRAAARFRQI